MNVISKASDAQHSGDARLMLRFATPEELIATIGASFELDPLSLDRVRSAANNLLGIGDLDLHMTDKAGRPFWVRRREADMHAGTLLHYLGSDFPDRIKPVTSPNTRPPYALVVMQMRRTVGNVPLRDEMITARQAARVHAEPYRWDIAYRAYWYVAHPVEPPLDPAYMQVGDRVRMRGNIGLEKGATVVTEIWQEDNGQWRVECETDHRSGDGRKVRFNANFTALVHERDWPLSFVGIEPPVLTPVASRDAAEIDIETLEHDLAPRPYPPRDLAPGPSTIHPVRGE